MTLQHLLEQKLGLTDVNYKHNLGKDQLFHEAIANDRGRLRLEGPDDEQKAYATKLGVDGPLVFYTDPTCTGRPVNDTFAVGWPEVDGDIWWKDNLKKYDPHKYEGLLKRVVRASEQPRPALSTCRTCSRARTPPIRCPIALSVSTRPTRCSRTTCSQRPYRRRGG